MKEFRLDHQYVIRCESQRTRYGFRHLATLHRGSAQVCKDKICYYNRTLESFTFQSVLHNIIRKYFEEHQAERYIKAVDAQGNKECEETFAPFKALCGLSAIMAKDKKEQNELDKKVLSALPGMDFPDDWDDLSEEEKRRRLDKVKGIL